MENCNSLSKLTQAATGFSVVHRGATQVSLPNDCWGRLHGVEWQQALKGFWALPLQGMWVGSGDKVLLSSPGIKGVTEDGQFPYYPSLLHTHLGWIHNICSRIEEKFTYSDEQALQFFLQRTMCLQMPCFHPPLNLCYWHLDSMCGIKAPRESWRHFPSDTQLFHLKQDEIATWNSELKFSGFRFENYIRTYKRDTMILETGTER